MSTKIRLKKSGATGNTPSSIDLEYGELALNYADGVLYYKDNANSIKFIAGASANAFETINANGTLIIADSNTDILSINPGDAVYVTGNGISDTLTIGVRVEDSVNSSNINYVSTANAVRTAYNLANTANLTASLAYNKANSAAITVREVYSSNQNVVNSFANINTIQFDTESGMAVVNESNSTVTIKLNSTFKYWNINGSPGLEAFGLDTVNFIPLDGLSISANNTNTPKSFIISAPGLVSGIANAANTVSISANSGGTLSAKKLNFINSSTILVNVANSTGGNANISFDFNSNDSTIIKSDKYTGTGSCTSFTLTYTSETDRTFVYIDGVSQKPSIDYQVANKSLTFNIAPPSNSSIEVRTLTTVANITNVSSIVSNQFLGNGSCTQFILESTTFSTNGVFIFVDGVAQVPLVDYSITGNTVNFTTAPENNGVIEIRSITPLQLFAYANTISETNTFLTISESRQEFRTNGFNNSLDSISRTYLLRGTTTNVTESEIFLSNGTRIPVAANSTVFYTADIVARRTDAANESSGFYIKGVVDNYSGTVADVGNLYEVVVAEDDLDWAVDARADDTNNSINIYVTGENAKTIRWTALVKTVEVAQ